MNYGQIKQNLISLGFADENDYLDYEEDGYTFDAINRAIATIGNYFPSYDKYKLEIDDTINTHLQIDMNTAVANFNSFADSPMMEEIQTGIFSKFTDYVLDEDETSIWIDTAKHKGTFWIRYRAFCPPITSATSDEYVPELPLKAHQLIPLLSAYYLWLDDEPTKAAQYYNMYETEISTLLQQANNPKMRVRTDWRIPCL